MKVQKTKSLTPFWYTMEIADETIDNPSFLLKPLSKFELAQIADYMSDDERTGTRNISAIGQYLAVQFSLKDMKNMFFEDGEPCEFTQWREILSPILVKLLAYEIIYRSSFSDEDAKKSSLQSKSKNPEAGLTAATANGEDTAMNQTPSPNP